MGKESTKPNPSKPAGPKPAVSKPAYAKLVKGYTGFLTGTGKSLSTIACYKGDLALFEEFLLERKKDFYKVGLKDLEAYQYWLEKRGMKINTRRRKILSAKSLVKYAVVRKKVAPSEVQFVRAPERLERLPWIPLPKDWEKIQGALKQDTALGLRNTLLVHLLAETGLAVAELCALRWDEYDGEAVNVGGKKPRRLALSPAARAWLSAWREQNSGKHLFPGFNRHGVTSEKMTPRGVELFFRVLGRNVALRQLKPKTLRHYAIVSWLAAELAEEEVQKRLGVHGNYSFEAYRKHLETRLA